MKKTRIMRKFGLMVLFVLCASYVVAQPASLLVEAESFENKGGWVVDLLFMDLMG